MTKARPYSYLSAERHIKKAAGTQPKRQNKVLMPTGRTMKPMEQPLQSMASTSTSKCPSKLVALTRKSRQHRKEAGMDGKFFLTATSQCAWPDANRSSVLNTHMNWFDAIFVQFYNNPECGIPSGYQKGSGGPSARRAGITNRPSNSGVWISHAGQAVRQVGVDAGNVLGKITSTSSSAITRPTHTPGRSAKDTASKPKIYVRVPGSEEGTWQPKMGYVTPDGLKSAISPFLGLKNFGGVSNRDAQYATSHGAFLRRVKALISAQ